MGSYWRNDDFSPLETLVFPANTGVIRRRGSFEGCADSGMSIDMEVAMFADAVSRPLLSDQRDSRTRNSSNAQLKDQPLVPFSSTPLNPLLGTGGFPSNPCPGNRKHISRPALNRILFSSICLALPEVRVDFFNQRGKSGNKNKVLGMSSPTVRYAVSCLKIPKGRETRQTHVNRCNSHRVEEPGCHYPQSSINCM